MDVAAYTQARYGTLLELAVELGAPEGAAAEYVDHVLLDNRAKIRRARDPDPMVREALARAIRHEPERSGNLLAVVVVVGAVLVSIGLAAILYDPPPRPLPSLFGYTGDQARTLLEREGYDVRLRPARACEPQGLVIGTSPPAGALASRGAGVSVRTAVPSGTDCQAEVPARTEAWAFVAWARGLGPAPAYAPEVVLVSGEAAPTTYTAAQAADRDTWAATLRSITSAATSTTRSETGMPRLVVTDGVPPAESCGVPVPADVADRAALRLAIDPADSEAESGGCPLTIDLYRTDGAIDEVVVRRPATGSLSGGSS